jgi:hypothetical protein
MLLTGRPVKATEARGWLVDWAGPMEEALAEAWRRARGADRGSENRPVARGAVAGIADDVPWLPQADSPLMERGREAIMTCVKEACGVPVEEALSVQARLAAEFLAGPECLDLGAGRGNLSGVKSVRVDRGGRIHRVRLTFPEPSLVRRAGLAGSVP